MDKFKSPVIQAMNIIRFVGDEVKRTGQPAKIDRLASTIGSANEQMAWSIVDELSARKLVNRGQNFEDTDGVFRVPISLTLAGWQKYEEERQGRLSGNYGFIAMKFGDPDLDVIVDFLKEQISQELGYSLVDLRDVERPGIIDDIMRMEIRDAAFVIVDLTHDNSGAYWEAGYAEGLGKPVVYVCEKNKFDEESTHFDTNHCTTITWSADNREGFSARLIATLRRGIESQGNQRTSI